MIYKNGYQKSYNKLKEFYQYWKALILLEYSVIQNYNSGNRIRLLILYINYYNKEEFFLENDKPIK